MPLSGHQIPIMHPVVVALKFLALLLKRLLDREPLLP